MKAFLKQRLSTNQIATLKRLRDQVVKKRRLLSTPFPYLRGFRHALSWAKAEGGTEKSDKPDQNNRLWNYFDQHHEGHGIWKWEHYFEIYERHFSKFVGRSPRVLEIGIYSGGSLGMWKDYFGEGCTIHGIDIEPACKVYEGPGIHVEIGDQEDPKFWREFLAKHPPLDIVIDDGGHTPAQQMTTLECVLPAMRPGGVFVCEDIHSSHNHFAAFSAGLVSALNADCKPQCSAFQSQVESIHHYPYCLVVEKRAVPRTKLHAPKRGTSWQPFFKD